MGDLRMMSYILLILGLSLLVKGASSVARRLKVSDLMIGLTEDAFRTSVPELFVNLFASAKGNTGIAFRSLLDGIIYNTFLIMSISEAIFPPPSPEPPIFTSSKP